MANDNNTSKPFEWLNGGLFFGKQKGGIESVDSEKDVTALLSSISDNLEVVVLEERAAAALLQDDPDIVEMEEPEESVNNNNNNNKNNKKPSQSKFLAARLARLRFLLYDERRMTSSQQDNNNSLQLRRATPSVALAMVKALSTAKLHTLIPKLIDNMQVLPFESRKHVAACCNYLLVCGFEGNDRELYIPIMNAFRDYVAVNFDAIVTPIVNGYDSCDSGSSGSTDVVLHCGSLYRSCFRHLVLYRELVATSERVAQYIFPFIDKHALLPNFDVSSDAMENLKLVMTAGGSDTSVLLSESEQRELSELAAAFLTRDYEPLWDQRFNPKLLSANANYMTKRVALQILSTVLLTRSNYAVMIKYVNSRANLIMVMKLLRDTSPHITLDAFHVFKVFVANPNKIPEVEKILRDNSQKLCSYLETLHQDKEASDNQFAEEKKLIIATIRGL
ncbi:MAG: hypothetical protein SGILL_001910 [Bacillariaceae sp.]